SLVYYLSVIRPPRSSTLFPYTTLFRSVPVIRPESPIIGTGIEYRAAKDSGQVVVARAAGTVRSVSATEIWVEEDEGDAYRYKLQDRKSTRLNSSHVSISYAVFCLKKKI